MKRITALLACCALASLAAQSQPAVVEAVQYPAWLERGGNAVPLMPGLQLEAQDRLRTGGNARAQLKLAEGSAVRLGENAQFVIERVEERGAFRATLAMIAGAFRFTTGSVGRTRDVTIKVKNVTAGIRGTDLWGKSTDERDLVALRAAAELTERVALSDSVAAVATPYPYDLSDAGLRAAVGDYVHAVGTCRMGAPDDEDAVVDTTCRVIGYEGLMVCDASVMPTVPRANTHLPTVMIAERIAAAMCNEAAGLP